MCQCLRSGPLQLILVNLAPKYNKKGQNVHIRSSIQTLSFSPFVLTSTTAIADADVWLVKACCALLNHRLHKNVKGTIQLLGVIKHTSPTYRPREKTQTSHRKIIEQKAMRCCTEDPSKYCTQSQCCLVVKLVQSPVMCSCYHGPLV